MNELRPDNTLIRRHYLKRLLGPRFYLASNNIRIPISFVGGQLKFVYFM